MQARLIMRPAVYQSGTNGAGLATMQASRWLAPAMRQGRLMPKMLVELYCHAQHCEGPIITPVPASIYLTPCTFRPMDITPGTGVAQESNVPRHTWFFASANILTIRRNRASLIRPIPNMTHKKLNIQYCCDEDHLFTSSVEREINYDSISSYVTCQQTRVYARTHFMVSHREST